MFGRWLKNVTEPRPLDGAERVEAEVRNVLRDADQETVRVVTAIAGLLGAVAYADREYSGEEEALVRSELARIQGMTSEGVDAVCAVLRAHIVEVATVQTPRYCRALLELADRELRTEVLQLLVDLAAADGTIKQSETNLVRGLAVALGLDQDDYNAAQAKHRDRLAVTRG
jgi:uncharacterized tellurite resistance protein B-like protein